MQKKKNKYSFTAAVVVVVILFIHLDITMCKAIVFLIALRNKNQVKSDLKKNLFKKIVPLSLETFL